MSDSGVDAGSDTDSLGEMSVGSSAGSQDGNDHHVQIHPPQVHVQQPEEEDPIQELELPDPNDNIVDGPAHNHHDNPINDLNEQSRASSSHLDFSWSNMPDIVLSSPSPHIFQDWRPPDEQHDFSPKMRTIRKSSFKPALLDYASHEFLSEKKLRSASMSGDVDLVRRLLDDGVEPSCSDNKHRTALHFAACCGNVQIARLLLERGADPNLQDVVGNTPLHLSACTNNTEMVTLLLKYGTDVTVLDKSGRTPLHLAEAKLKILQNPRDIPSTSTSPPTTNINGLKVQVLQVIEMIQVYLQRSGKHDTFGVLSNFSSRIHQHQTKEEVDLDVHDLLSSLSHLSLQNNNNL